MRCQSHPKCRLFVDPIAHTPLKMRPTQHHVIVPADAATVMQMQFHFKRAPCQPPPIHLSHFPLCPFSFVHAPSEVTRTRDNGTQQREGGGGGAPHSRGCGQFVPVLTLVRCSFPSRLLQRSSLSSHLKCSIIFDAIRSKLPKCLTVTSTLD